MNEPSGWAWGTIADWFVAFGTLLLAVIAAAVAVFQDGERAATTGQPQTLRAKYGP